MRWEIPRKEMFILRFSSKWKYWVGSYINKAVIQKETWDSIKSPRNWLHVKSTPRIKPWCTSCKEGRKGGSSKGGREGTATRAGGKPRVGGALGANGKQDFTEEAVSSSGKFSGRVWWKKTEILPCLEFINIEVTDNLDLEQFWRYCGGSNQHGISLRNTGKGENGKHNYKNSCQTLRSRKMVWLLEQYFFF